jgi:hypothetical protein
MPVNLDCSMDIMGENSDRGSQAGLTTPVHPGSRALREALRNNIVAFPSRIPVLLKRPGADLQWRAVLLYFVRGWRLTRIAARFGVPKHRIQTILNEWCVRALALGCVQVIDAEAFAASCRIEGEAGAGRDAGPLLSSAVQRMTDAHRPLGADAPAIPGGLPPAGGVENTLVASLDNAIAHCEEWPGEFWACFARRLRELRNLGAEALELQTWSRPTEKFFDPAGSNGNSLQHGQASGKEGVFHAVV